MNKEIKILQPVSSVKANDEFALSRSGNIEANKATAEQIGEYALEYVNIQAIAAGSSPKDKAQAATVPTPTPTEPEWYLAEAGVTYANFKDDTNTAITIPTTVGDKDVINARLVYNGAFWVAIWDLVDLNRPPIGTLKVAVSLGGDPASGEYNNLLMAASYDMSFFKVKLLNAQLVVLGTGNTVAEGGTFDRYVKVDPFDIDLNDGEFLYLGKTANPAVFDPIGVSEGYDTLVYAKKSNWFNSGQNRKANVILCYWYNKRLECYNDTFSKAFEYHRNFGRHLTIYDDGNVSVTRNNDNSVTIVNTNVMPVIFDDAPSNFMTIAANQTFTVQPAEYLVLSVSQTEYRKPNLQMPTGTLLYFFGLNFQAADVSQQPIILGFAASSHWIARYPVLDIPAAPAPPAPYVSPYQGKKVTVEGDSIMEQGQVTGNIAARTGAIMDVKAVSGSGYVQNVNGTIRSRIAAAIAANPAALIIAGGTNDFGFNSPLGSPAVLNDDTQFYSAVYNTFKAIKAAAPTLPVLAVTPIVRNYNNTEPRGFVNANGVSLRAFCDAIVWCAREHAIEVCDLNYISGITYDNIFPVAPDGVHVNALGGKMMGGKITAQLNNLINPNF